MQRSPETEEGENKTADGKLQGHNINREERSTIKLAKETSLLPTDLQFSRFATRSNSS